MNRYMRFTNMKINLGKEMIEVPIKFTHNEPYNNIEVIVFKREIDKHIVYCDVRISYGTLERRFGFKKRDLYYIGTPLQTISSREIEEKIIESRYIRDIILGKI